jgi:hypothetical protein
MPARSGQRLREERLQGFLAADGRPAYHMTDKVLPPLCGEEHLGFCKRILRDEKPGMPRPRFHPGAAAFFRELLAMGVPSDRWARFTRNQLLHRYGTFLALEQVSADPDLRSRVEPLVALARKDSFCLTGMVEMLTEYGPDRPTWERAMAYLEEAVPLRDETLDKERVGREDYLRGFLAFRLGDLAATERFFERSLEGYPAPDNASRLALARLERVKSQRKR